jgi:IgA peptidase M64
MQGDCKMMRSSPSQTSLALLALAFASLQCSSSDPDSEAMTPDVAGAPDPAEEVPAAIDQPEPAVPGASDVDLPGEGLGPDDVQLVPSPEPPGEGEVELTSPVPPLVAPALDCGPDGWAVENAGPPANRVNYVILADGYGDTTVDTTLEEHILRALDRRFNHESGEPYGRYRKFVNICVMKVVSESDGIGNGPTAFDGGNGGDRLARVNTQKVNAYLDQNLPETLEVDWRAVVLNQNRWENTGSLLMLWSGAHDDAPGAALHEGGHGFHQLADEYCGSATGPRCGANVPGAEGDEFSEVNSTGDPQGTDGKWDLWLGSVQKGLKVPDLGATGLQGVFVGSRYVDGTQYRPSSNSMMNSLFGDNVNTSFNSVSREQMIFSIWRAVRPIDSTVPPPGAVADVDALTVNVIDPAVIDIDWTIDGDPVAERAGGTLNLAAAGLSPGAHTIVARAYDNASEDLVRNRTGECPGSVTGRYCHASGWLNSTQTVQWTVEVP